MPASSVSPSTGFRVAILVAFVLSLGAIRWLDRSRGRRGTAIRRRFVLGVPWGTVVTILGVASVYLFLQGGYQHWYRPVTVPYSAWSYLYPLGWLTAPFAHAGPGHLLNNLMATLVLAPIAEYVWGHYPRERGAHSFGSARTNPWARAFVLFPLGVFGIGILSGLLAWGPVIGFSGVVFAFVGFALVRYPIVTLVALAGRSAVRVVYNAFSNPIVIGEASSTFSAPWWAGIAVQGHALGLFLGVLAGTMLLWRRDESPDPFRLWIGSLIAGFSLSLWAVWWYRGSSEYVLYRGLGVVLVFAFALLITVGVVATNRPLFSLSTLRRGPLTFTRRQVAVLGLAVPLLMMAGVAVPLNLITVADASNPGGGTDVTVEDYTVAYAEDVPNGLVSAIDADLFGEDTAVNASGVIVVSEKRHIWSLEVSKQRVAHSGSVRVVVGGPGWREVVHVQRTGWNVHGGESVYRVDIGTDRNAMEPAFASDPAEADLTIADRNVSVVPDDDGFRLRVTANDSTVAWAAIPERNESVTLDGIAFVREDDEVIANHDGTRITVAKAETYD